jgi:hypothetical protein
MTLVDAQPHRLLELVLRETDEEPVGFATLHDGGKSLSAAVASELALTDTNRARL